MPRYTDVDALIDDLTERYCKECGKRKGIKNGKYRIIYEIGEAPCRACDVDDMKVELEEAPTADVRENVHGKWGYSLAGNWKCSVCGDEPYYDSRKGLNFCPNCGADMRERSEE